MRLTKLFSVLILLGGICFVLSYSHGAYAASSADIQKLEKLVKTTAGQLAKAQENKNKKNIAFYAQKLKERKASLKKLKQQNTGISGKKISATSSSSADVKKLEKLLNDTKTKLNQAKKKKNKKDIAFYTKKLKERQATLAKTKQGVSRTDTFSKTTNTLVAKVTQQPFCICAVEGKDDLKCRETNAKGITKVVFNADPPAKHWNRIPKHCAPPLDPCVKASEWQRSEWVTVWKTKWTRKTCNSNSANSSPTYNQSDVRNALARMNIIEKALKSNKALVQNLPQLALSKTSNQSFEEQLDILARTKMENNKTPNINLPEQHIIDFNDPKMVNAIREEVEAEFQKRNVDLSTAAVKINDIGTWMQRMKNFPDNHGIASVALTKFSDAMFDKELAPIFDPAVSFDIVVRAGERRYGPKWNTGYRFNALHVMRTNTKTYKQEFRDMVRDMKDREYGYGNEGPNSDRNITREQLGARNDWATRVAREEDKACWGC